MNKVIFRSSFLTAVLVLTASLILITGVLFQFFEGQIRTELESEANYIAHAVETGGLDYFSDFESSDRRVTLVAEDGSVIYDTEANAYALDNHSDREEIKEAAKTGKGMSIRYSDTLAEKTVYFAVRMADNRILRVSTNQYTVFAVLLNLITPFLLILLIALLLSYVLSSKVSKSIVKPINELDLENPEDNNSYEELTPLLRKISVQKKTINQQLNEAHKRQEEFNLITENMSEGFLMIDKNTNLLTHNTAALKLLGIENTDGGSVLALCRAKGFREVIAKVLGGEYVQNKMTQNERCYNLIANPVFESGDIIGAVIIIIDITESEKREILRREFTANVSHELKTPLTSISGFAELMKNGGTPDETVVDFSKSIYDEAQRLISLVSDIIKISELDEKNIPFEREEVDLFEMSEEIIKRLKKEAEKKNISFMLKGGPAKVFGVPKILDEMLYNLCENAVKYNKENGSVNIILNTEGDKVNVTVKDTGIGIPPDHQQRVFERFYRVDKSHSKEIGGTGLGLAIVKHGAICHNAEISLESAENKGTSVTISFDKMH